MDGARYDIGRLKRAALEKGLPGYRVAQKAGLSPVTVGKVFRGESANPTTIAKIAAALGVNLPEIVVSAGQET